MPQKIHFRDDIFLLSVILKTLEACVTVRADAGYYHEKVVGDVFFVDATLRGMAEILVQNSHLVGRDEYLRLLERVSGDFCQVLDKLLPGGGPVAEDYAAIEPQIKTLIAGQKSIGQHLRSILLSGRSVESVDADLVSGDEIERLLSE